jgi:hypothetical protein
MVVGQAEAIFFLRSGCSFGTLDRLRIMKARHVIGVCMVCLVRAAFGQGFVNLDFEQATIAPTPVGQYGAAPADPALTFPGWTMGRGGTFAPNYTLYNNLTLGSVAQVLIGPSYPNAIGYTPLQGSYSALLQFGPSLALGTPALIQSGLVPAGTRSINFLVSATQNDARVTLDGVDIPLIDIGGDRLAGDVTAFAGQQAQLMFSTTSYSGNWLYFDDVTFSPVAVPEPSTFGLSVLVVVTVLLVRRRRSNPRSAVDGGIASLFQIERPQPAATDRDR